MNTPQLWLWRSSRLEAEYCDRQGLVQLIDQTHIGLTRERQQIVTEERTASHVGSGSLGVYATPAMLALIESTCRDLLEEVLDDAHTSVGTSVNLRHLAPTPQGNTVTVRVEIVAVEGMLVEFSANVWDKLEPIGAASHTRAVIDVQRFLKRVNSKASDKLISETE